MHRCSGRAVVVRMIAIVAALLSSLLTVPATGVASSLPAGIKLEHGDLIWARNKDRWIPYKIPQLKALINAPRNADDWAGAAKVATLTNQPRQAAGRKYELFFDTLQWSVGHVAIVSRSGNKISIVEAANEDEGVTSTPLKEWPASWSKQDVFWIGRLDGIDKTDIAKFVAVAEMQATLKRPCDIKNTNLGDDTSFYCSKLVWFALMKALNKAADGNPSPDRLLPYSPKQLIHSPLVRLVYGLAKDY